MAPPSEPQIPVDSVQQMLAYALLTGGIVGIDEDIEQPILNFALVQANWLLAEWARQRWLCYRIQDYSFVSTGAQTYSVGRGQTVDINPRPDRLEYAFMRFLQTSNPGNLAVDIPLDIIQSHEDYSRITVKNVGTLPWRIFYDPVWPVGLLFPWPVPQASLYEIHVGFKVVLPRFASLTEKVNFPPEYEAALVFGLAQSMRVTYQMPGDPMLNAKYRVALNSIRNANAAMSTMVLPSFLRNRNRAYDYRGDSDSF